MVSKKTRRQLYIRRRLVRQYLAAELRLVNYYKRRQSEHALSQAEREYIERVIAAWNKLTQYARNFPDAPMRVKFIEVALMRGDNDMTAVCDTLHICPATYYNWRKSMIRAFGLYMGICTEFSEAPRVRK